MGGTGQDSSSKDEKQKFFREYLRIGGNEIHFMEKLLPIASDPYIAGRAKSIHFLFSGIDCALRNRMEIVAKATTALYTIENKSNLDRLIQDIPEFIKRKSRNFGDVSDVIVQHLLQDPINAAKQRVGLSCEHPLLGNVRELRGEISRLMRADPTEQQRRELEIIESALSRLTFGQCLDLYSRYCKKYKPAEVLP